MDDLIKITPDKEKAKSILKMVETTLEMLEHIDIKKFPSNVTKEYYAERKLPNIKIVIKKLKTLINKKID